MTSTNAAATDGAGIHERSPTTIKGTLFCRSCGYEAPWNAGWHVSTETSYREVYCPNCGTQIA